MREIPSGWLLRYLHANGSSFLFILLYLHIARGLYFVSFRKPKQWVWCSGVILFILMAGIAFLGYTLPLGQMSFWGSTVITNLITALPILGEKLVIWIWGGFAISQSTLNRFFSLHYILSIIALGLSMTHLILLHMVGSTTPVVNETELDNLKFSPASVTKDALTFFFFLLFYLSIVLYKPNIFGHPDNYIRADALITPAHIVPEWYFLPFYAMLKAFPSKGAGALAMLSSMLILITAPWLDGLLTFGGLTIDPRYRPFFKIIFILFIIDMLMLGWLGSLAVSDINQIWMQICTLFYFAFWVVFIPFFNYLESFLNTVLLSQKIIKPVPLKKKIKVFTNVSIKTNPQSFSLQFRANTFAMVDNLKNIPVKKKPSSGNSILKNNPRIIYFLINHWNTEDVYVSYIWKINKRNRKIKNWKR